MQLTREKAKLTDERGHAADDGGDESLVAEAPDDGDEGVGAPQADPQHDVGHGHLGDPHLHIMRIGRINID